MLFRRLLTLFLTCNAAVAWADSAPEISLRLHQAGLTRQAVQIRGFGSQNAITFGAEKEGSSPKITRIYGPKNNFFLRKVQTMNEPHRREFLIHFLQGLRSGTMTTQTPVLDIDGQRHDLDLNFLNYVVFENQSTQNLERFFSEFLEQTNNKSFSFLRPSVRAALFRGTFPGQIAAARIHPGRDSRQGGRSVYFQEWEALYGEPQRYVQSVVGQVSIEGWEVQFTPQNSYGEFLAMIDWFQNVMATGDRLMDPPKHVWIVTPSTPELMEKRQDFARYLNLIQVLIITDSLARENGIELAVQKQPQTIESLATLQTGRGTIRLENGRFGNTIALEIRDGTIAADLRNFLIEDIVSRMATLDFSIPESARSWEPNFLPTAENISERFDVPVAQARRLLSRIDQLLRSSGRNAEQIPFMSKHILLAPLWNWEELDLVSGPYQNHFKQNGRDYIDFVLSMNEVSTQSVREKLGEWSRGNRLAEIFKEEIAVSRLGVENNQRVQINRAENNRLHACRNIL